MASLPTRDEFVSSLKPIHCNICYEPFTAEHFPVEIPDCRHVFGQICLLEWFNTETQETSHSCPMCRNPLFHPAGGPAEHERVRREALRDLDEGLEDVQVLGSDMALMAEVDPRVLSFEELRALLSQLNGHFRELRRAIEAMGIVVDTAPEYVFPREAEMERSRGEDDSQGNGDDGAEEDNDAISDEQ